jgi:hypothetical protein
MAFVAKDKSKHTNIDSMRHADAKFMASQPKPEAVEPGEEEQGELEPHHEQIHEHLRSMHEQTGEAHSHVEHHGDGTHTSHHVTKEGEVTGPHHHNTAEEAKAKLDEFFNEEAKEPQHEGGEEGY